MNSHNEPILPLGFGIHLANDGQAYENYKRLTKDQKIAIIDYVRGCKTGSDTKKRIVDTVEHLRNNTYRQLI